MLTIRKIEPGDAPALLQFEEKNRAWFEQFVEPRGDKFYSLTGVEAHINDCLAEHKRRAMHPCVILDDDGILIGRANLRAINTVMKTCDLGYRIGEHHVGQGVATQAVKHLKKLARSQWHLTRMTAYVAIENQASIRVLEKNGFEKVSLFPELATIAERLHDCYEFVHWLN